MFRVFLWAMFVALQAGCAPADEPSDNSPAAPSVTPAAREASAPQEDYRVAGRRAIERGVQCLIAAQTADGSWRSATYGPMRGGVGNTALAVYGLTRGATLPTREAHAAAERGARFLLSNVAPAGFVRGADGKSDYPTYGTALLLAALPKLALEVNAETIGRLQAYVRSAQLNARQGVQPSDREFGGWPQTGGDDSHLKRLGDTNISVTLAALEGLEAGGVLSADVREATLAYLAHCQNWSETAFDDGGFFFTPDAADPRNKAGQAKPGRARSYGSATADGLCALALCGMPENTRRREAAAGWLRQRFGVDEVAGFERPADRTTFAAALYYYNAAATAHCLRRVPEFDSAERRSALVLALVRRQQPDGSWRNASPHMYEDDPLLATSLALAALGRLCE
ncbi:MAG: hypothetical protein QM775_05745 [Pirellulales bacterium]